MSAKKGDDIEVHAAGGVVWRRHDGDLEVLLVHRPKYGDWSLPKGKLDRGESEADAARREVLEETGLRCELGPEVAVCRYLDGKGRRKQVRYWAMTVAGGSFAVNDEVDAVRWLSLAGAGKRLTYRRDVDVLDAFAAVRPR